MMLFIVTLWQHVLRFMLYSLYIACTVGLYCCFYASTGYAQHISGRYYVFTMSRCLSDCPVPTWTRPQDGRGGRVHYTHATAEASNDRQRSVFSYCTANLDQRSWATPGPVNTSMGNRFMAGKPSWCRASHPGLLSPVIPPWIGAMSTSEIWGVNRHTTWCTSRYPCSRSVSWCLTED